MRMLSQVQPAYAAVDLPYEIAAGRAGVGAPRGGSDWIKSNMARRYFEELQ